MLVWVHAPCPRGVGTPHGFNARASAAWPVMPVACSRFNTRANRWAARVAAWERARDAAAGSGPRVGRQPRSPPRTVPRALAAASAALVRADQLALLLRHRRIDPHHQVIGTPHVGGADRDAILQQLRLRVRPARDPIEACRHGGCRDHTMRVPPTLRAQHPA